MDISIKYRTDHRNKSLHAEFVANESESVAKFVKRKKIADASRRPTNYQRGHSPNLNIVQFPSQLETSKK